jgi:DNA-binding XRE family transcriptional regulator
MRPVDARIDVHQIRGHDFRPATPAELCHASRTNLSLKYAIWYAEAEVLTKCGISVLPEPTALNYRLAMISGKQIRAARALVGWRQRELAAAAGVSEISIKNAERGVVDSRGSTLNAIQLAFDRAGVIFLDTGDTRSGGPGVRLKGG